MNKRKSTTNKWQQLLYLGYWLVTSACDFGPSVNHDILKAQDSLQKRDFVAAVNLYQKILQKRPETSQQVIVFFQLSEIYLQHFNDHQKAVDFLKKIIFVSDDPFWIVKTEEKLAEIYFSYLKDYPSSIRSYRNLFQFRPKLEKYDFYQFRLGKSFLENRDYQQAIEVFNNISNYNTHEFYIQSFYELGNISFMQKDWVNAISYWQKFVALETRRDNIVQAKFLMANAYETMEDLPNAYNLYYSILGEYPNTQVIQNRLNSIYNRKVARKR